MKVMASNRDRVNYTTPLEEESNDTLSRELKKMRDLKTQEMEASWAGSGFPKTSNQEYHKEPLVKKNLDKHNFKKKNAFMAYVDSTYNSGVFTHPWRDMY